MLSDKQVLRLFVVSLCLSSCVLQVIQLRPPPHGYWNQTLCVTLVTSTINNPTIKLYWCYNHGRSERHKSKCQRGSAQVPTAVCFRTTSNCSGTLQSDSFHCPIQSLSCYHWEHSPWGEHLWLLQFSLRFYILTDPAVPTQWFKSVSSTLPVLLLTWA